METDDTESERPLIARDLKHYHGTFKVRLHRAGITKGVLNKVWFTLHTFILQRQPIITFLVPKYIIGTDILASWHNPHTGFLLHRTQANLISKVKRKILQLFISSQDSKSKLTPSSGQGFSRN